MATIHKLTKDGATIFPATITDAVVHPQTGKTLTSMMKDYNVSELFPTEGVDGGNKYNLTLAIQVLGTHLTSAQKTGGIKLTFISSVLPYPEEEYYLWKSTWSTVAADWNQRFEVGDVVADPSGSWSPSTAEAYIDQQIATEATTRLDQDVYTRSLIPLADEEDITKNGQYLKFKDRIYNQVSPNGMGKVILRNNIVNGVNTLVQTMINQANTIYVIQYDFTLGEDITIPANCVLEFDGGNISGNGIDSNTITGVNTGINAWPVKIFSIDIALAGTWDVAEAYLEWFGAKGDGITDDTFAIQKCFDSFTNISVFDKTYIVNSIDANNICLTLPYNRTLCGHRTQHIAEHEIINIQCTNNSAKTVLLLRGKCEVKDITIGNTSSRTDISEPLSSFNACIRTEFSSGVKLYNVRTEGGDIGLEIYSYLTQIISCHSYHNNIGFYVHGAVNDSLIPTVENTTVSMLGCYAILSRMHGYFCVGLTYSSFINLASDGCGHNINVPVNSYSDVNAPYYFSYCKCCNLLNSGVENSLKFIKTLSCGDFKVENCRFVYGYHTQQMLGGTYTPARLYEFMFGGVEVEGLQMIVGGVNASALSESIADYSPLAYIEDNESYAIKYRFSNFVKYTQIGFGGYATLYKNVYIEDVVKNTFNYSLSAGSLIAFLSNLPLYLNHTNDFNVTLDANNREAGAYAAKTIDLYGKTLVIRKGSYSIITFYGQAHPITFRNGKVIFINVDLSGGGNTSNTTYIFRLNHCDVEFYNCTISGFTNIQAIAYAESKTEFVKAINTENVDVHTIIDEGQSVIIDANQA